MRRPMPQHLDTVLPLLSQCVSAQDAMPLQAALTSAFSNLAEHSPEAKQTRLAAQRATLESARSSAELRVAAARLLRELVQETRELEDAAPKDPEPPRPTREERKRARAARTQARALEAHRSSPLRPAEQPVETLSGVGGSIGQTLRARGIATLSDLIWLLPLAYEDEREITAITALQPGVRVVTEGTVVRSAGGGWRGRGRPAEVVLEGEGATPGRIGVLRLVWFRAPPGLLERFPAGARYRVSGVVEQFRAQLQITHPETQRLGEGEAAAPRGIVPRYPIVAGVPPRKLTSCIQQAVQRAVHDLDEAVPESVRRDQNLSTLAAALRALHAPPAELADEELVRWNEARTEHHTRLAFEEFFLLELALFRRRIAEQGVVAEPLVPHVSTTGGPNYRSPLERVHDAFGFELTDAQRRVSQEIFTDLAQPRPMRRLLQGDVGCGKTAVAMLAAAQCIASGAQVAFMAPTEVLAEQHFRSLGPLSQALGVRAALMLGSERESHRKKARKSLLEGKIDLVVGTHALLSEGVRFARLRLAIIDEQHRFGVGQRLRLLDKTDNAIEIEGTPRRPHVAPHLLVMTATPIPRTLTLALYGDLSASVIDQMPEGRIPPVTREYPLAERERALTQVTRALEAGGQAFVVCPTIEENEENLLSAVEKTFAELEPRFAQFGVALLHGRLPADKKQAAMERFASGQVRVLVSTTIIEVGIDVPQANVILIENAERFGLAQLHQLRGRVGRSGQRSACLLVHQAVGEEARARMRVMCETSDGFRIAEEDLRLRGPGEIFGHRQSGLPGFRFGDLRRDLPLLAAAREAAQRVIDADPELASDELAGARRVLDRSNEGIRRVVKEEAG
jgi:ATP-dependent DNA helicase RecG